MAPLKYFLSISLCLFVSLLKAQELPVNYSFGEKYSDRYKYSNLLDISEDGKGGSILVRSYYTGIILKPKGYYIEHYNKDLELIAEYNYKLKGFDFINAFVKNGQLNLLLLHYNSAKETYDYVVHRSPIVDYNFTTQPILSVPSNEVSNPLDHNYYNRNFSRGFTTTAFFNTDESAFVISTHFKQGNEDKHMLYMFNSSLNKLLEYDFSGELEEKNYAFENIVTSKNLEQVYLVGKAYFKKKRFAVTDRKFQYELLKISKEDAVLQSFDDAGRFSESLKPIITRNKLICVGFYADRKDNRYNGLAYFDLDPNTLAINVKKYNPFSKQFMDDKFGRGEDIVVKNLVFKDLSITPDNAILFNAEEYFVTSSVQADPTGSRIKINRYHYNDIVSAKLSVSGEMIWARNINKAEVTQGDGAYASYSTIAKGDDTYYLISTAAENPQLLSGDRLFFKQGLSRNRNVFMIMLDKDGKISYEKVIDDKEARLPLMVAMPLIDTVNNSMLYYAKRGSRKQLVKVQVGTAALP
ncbi:hypothetical protein KCTC52924_01198 [Arenibacter antarcticus]|uniref:Uncharacterized protein n=1 Tax=Arenibacter antarcticus TaxID=2040469 RepID=A0ABW5VB91_9FLAO|nr:hypothetical protein [Arenibacter sp. H213]MCM4167981.1 hypothetical protein [Arenibacter sp. H213]